MKDIMKFFKKDKFAEHLGIELVEVSKGRARAKMKIEEHHLNGLNIGHGGAIFALADLAFAVASNSYGTVAMAINVSISYVKAAVLEETLFARAEEVSRNPKLATYMVHITDEKGQIVALFQGMVYRKKELLEVCES